MTKYYTILLALFFSFFIGSSVIAADVVSIDNSSQTNLMNTNSNQVEQGQSFIAANNNISAFSVQSGDTGYTMPQYFTIALREDTASSTLIASRVISGVTFNPNTTYGFSFDQPIPTTIGNSYIFTFTSQSNNALQNFTFKASSPGDGTYANGDQVVCTPGNNPVCAHYSGRDLWFKIYYDNTYAPPTSGWNIIAGYPLTGMTFASSTINFIVDYTVPAGDTGHVFVWTNPIGGGGIQLHDLGDTASTSGEIIKPATFVDGQYNWYAQLVDAYTANTMATSTLENFTINLFSGVNFLSPCADYFSGDICAGIATSSSITDLHLFGDMECGFKKAGLWAFCPSQSSVQGIYLAYQDFKTVFPFNAFFGVTDAISSAIATTTPTDSSFSIPFPTATGTISMLPIISTSSIPNLIGADNNSLFRLTIGWIFWILAAILIFLQLKSI